MLGVNSLISSVETCPKTNVGVWESHRKARCPHHSCILIPQSKEEWGIKTLPDQCCWDLRKFLFLEKHTEAEKTTEFL